MALAISVAKDNRNRHGKGRLPSMKLRKLPFGTYSDTILIQSAHIKLESTEKRGTHKHLPSSLGAIHNPRKRTIFGCLHSAMIRHSLSKYFIT